MDVPKSISTRPTKGSFRVMIGVPSTKARRVGGHCVAVVCAVAKRRLRTNRTTARDEELSILSVLDAAQPGNVPGPRPQCHAMDRRTVPGSIEETSSNHASLVV